MFLQCFDTVGWVIWPVKTCPRYDLYCVWWDVKPYSINQSIEVAMGVGLELDRGLYFANAVSSPRSPASRLRRRQCHAENRSPSSFVTGHTHSLHRQVDNVVSSVVDRAQTQLEV